MTNRSTLESSIIDSILSREVPLSVLRQIRQMLDRATSPAGVEPFDYAEAFRLAMLDAVTSGSGFLRVTHVPPNQILINTDPKGDQTDG